MLYLILWTMKGYLLSLLVAQVEKFKYIWLRIKGLAAVYQKADCLLEILRGKENPVVVVIVCGGNMVSLDKLKEWKESL